MTLKLQRRSYRKARDVAQQLVRRIREGRPGYLRGAFLPTITELAVEFVTSRKTMKRALELAVEDGAVTPSLHGPHVSETALELTGPGIAGVAPSRPRWEEVIDFLRVVEPQVAAQAALGVWKNALGRKNLEAVARRLEAHWNDPSPDVALEDDRDFHMGLAGLCQNNKFYLSIRDCYARIEKPQRGKAHPNNLYAIGPSPLLLCMHAWYRDETREQHLKIFRAIIAGQSERARTAMALHIEYAGQKFREMKRDVEKGY